MKNVDLQNHQNCSTRVSFVQKKKKKKMKKKKKAVITSVWACVVSPFRIRVRGPRGPHCHRRDRAPRSSSVHWSRSQETRAAETQSQAQGTSAPSQPFSTHTNPHRAFLPLISRETTVGKRWLWSGVIFFGDWAAISCHVIKVGGKMCVRHIYQTAGPVG